jgi:hypothetical protein
MIIYTVILILGVVGFFIHWMMSPRPVTFLRLVELFLLYQLIFSVGLSSFLAFFGLTFMTQFVADYTDWPASPFEVLLGNVNLGYGVLGILCIWFRDNFWTATILGQSIWLLGDAVAHLYEMIYHHNHTLGNIGMPLYTDIIIPIVLLILLAVYKYLQYRERVTQSRLMTS